MVPGQIFFLKRFITEYVRENMSVINTDEMADDRDQGEEIHASYNDERDYVCRTWQLEPKLRFLYWNSALEAPGIDAILQRVSFCEVLSLEFIEQIRETLKIVIS